jgi:hypothetical protein
LFPDLVSQLFRFNSYYPTFSVDARLTIEFYFQPQKRFFDAALSSKNDDASKSKAPDASLVPPKSPALYKVASSPEFGLSSVLGATSREERKFNELSPLVQNKNTTAITIENTIPTDSHAIPMW